MLSSKRRGALFAIVEAFQPDRERLDPALARIAHLAEILADEVAAVLLVWHKVRDLGLARAPGYSSEAYDQAEEAAEREYQSRGVGMKARELFHRLADLFEAFPKKPAIFREGKIFRDIGDRALPERAPRLVGNPAGLMHARNRLREGAKILGGILQSNDIRGGLTRALATGPRSIALTFELVAFQLGLDAS